MQCEVDTIEPHIQLPSALASCAYPLILNITGLASFGTYVASLGWQNHRVPNFRAPHKRVQLKSRHV